MDLDLDIRNGSIILALLALIVAFVSYFYPPVGELFVLFWAAFQLPAEGPIGMLPVIGQQIQSTTGWIYNLLTAFYSGLSVMIVGGFALGVRWWKS